MDKTTFEYKPVLGGFEEGVTRRDPSPVIMVDGTYHVWYSRTTETSHGYTASIWHATSRDGHEWTEHEEAVPRGPLGAYDEHGVFTPTVLVAETRYFLVYTAVPSPFEQGSGSRSVGTKTAIGIAAADSPFGPWIKHKGNPILQPSDNPDAFDSYRVDDACFVVRDGKYRLYYKGRRMHGTPGETKTGVAIADTPLGPYRKHENNPLIGSGHEVCVYPRGSGVMAIVSPTGPEGRTIQHSKDGLHFEITERDIDPPSAPGPYRKDHYGDGEGPGISWGLCQNVHDKPEWPFLMRFDCTNRHTKALGRRIERHRAFYSRKEPGQPLIYINGCRLPNLNPFLCRNLHEQGHEKGLSSVGKIVKEYVTMLRDSLVNFYDVEDDSVPGVWVYWGIGGITAAMIGSDPVFDDTTSWLEPALSWEEIGALKFNPENRWVEFALNINRELWKRWEEDFVVLPYLHRSPLDAANGIRGTELFAEMYSEPDRVRALVDWCADWSLSIEQFLAENAPRPSGWGTGVWGAWLPDKAVFVNGDPVGLVSREQAETFDRPATERLFTSTGGGLFHNHTIGLYQADLVSSYSGTLLQWFIDDPQQPSFSEALIEMPEVRDKLIAASLECPIAGTVPYYRLDDIMDIVRQGRFVLSVSAPGNVDPAPFLRKARRPTP